jgi:Holliday junction resolvase RusA-like endonuclease
MTSLPAQLPARRTVFSMVVCDRPASKKSATSGYQLRLRIAAQQKCTSAPIARGELYSRVIWFHTVPVRGHASDPDVDNILKAIHDSLKGVVYDDDFLITKCCSQRVFFSDAVTLPAEGIDQITYADLAMSLGDRHKHVLYIEIGFDNPGTVRFGPVE